MGEAKSGGPKEGSSELRGEELSAKRGGGGEYELGFLAALSRSGGEYDFHEFSAVFSGEFFEPRGTIDERGDGDGEGLGIRLSEARCGHGEPADDGGQW